MSRVLYPGSFDPIHNGHVEIATLASALFGEVIVAAMVNPQKPDPFFPLDQRRAMTEEALAHLDHVRVEFHEGLVVDVARAVSADFVVKGLRTAGDFEVEMQQAHTNHAVSGMRTVFLPTSPALSFLSSRYVREIAREGGDVSSLVPAPVARRLTERFAR